MSFNYTLELFKKESLNDNQINEMTYFHLSVNKERLNKDIINPSQFFTEKLNNIIYKYNEIFNDIEFLEEEYTREDLIRIENEYIEEVRNEYNY